MGNPATHGRRQGGDILAGNDCPGHGTSDESGGADLIGRDDGESALQGLVHEHAPTVETARYDGEVEARKLGD